MNEKGLWTIEDMIPVDVKSIDFAENFFIKTISGTPDKWLEFHFNNSLRDHNYWQANHIKKIAEIRGIKLTIKNSDESA